MGGQDARRPHRRSRLGHRAGGGRPGPRRHLRRQLRRLLGAGRRHLHPREVRVRHRPLFGISNLVTLMNTVPPYWKPWQAVWKVRMGDYTTEAGRRFLEERSPLTRVDRIGRPLLIAQGANDVRVKPSESEQIVAAMQARRIPVTYISY